MKKQLFALLGLGLLMATAFAYAQTGVVKMNIPFNFIVGKTTLPAGDYTIENVSDSAQAILVANSDRTSTAMLLANACESTTAAPKTKLVFHRYGNQYFLAQIWKAGNDRGQELPQSRRETEVAMSSPAQNVVVVATLR